MRRASERSPVLVMFGVATAQRDFRLVDAIAGLGAREQAALYGIAGSRP